MHMLVDLGAEWQAEHTERNLMNVDGVIPRSLRHQLPRDIDRYQLAEYGDKYCKVGKFFQPDTHAYVAQYNAEDQWRICEIWCYEHWRLSYRKRIGA